jgi:hypothetical protein
MSLAEFCRSVRSHWQAIVRQLWPESPHARLQAEARRLDAELRHCYEGLLRLRRRIEGLRARLDKVRRRRRSRPS